MLLALCAASQTQQGYVKTKGRLVNGNVVAGQRLSGTTVQIKGRNAVLSKGNGSFSFIVPANKFFIQSVKKQGYVLSDPDVLSKPYSYSSNPLILVMETPNQQMEDKLATERKLRRTLFRQLQQREDEIERLKEQNELTEDQYHKSLQDLYDEQEKSLNLVSQMAERYSKIDFDQIDEFNRRVSECIIEGRLTEADSLIKSKGDLKERIDAHNKHHEANVQARKNLEDSEAMELKDREDLAQDCYSQFLIHKLQHHPDSAAYYIEQRAMLDTTNVDWLYEAGCYLANIGNFDKALSMFLIAHQIASSSDKYIAEDGSILRNIARIYRNSGQANHEKSVDYYELACEAFKKINNPNELMKCYSTLQALTWSSLSFGDRGDRKQYIRDLKAKMMHLQDSIYSCDTIDIDNLYYDFNDIYLSKKNRDLVAQKAINYYEHALQQTHSLYGDDTFEVAKIYRSLGKVYCALKDSTWNNDNMDLYYRKAYSIISRIDSLNPLLVDLYDERASFYENRGTYISKNDDDFLTAIDYKKQVVKIWSSLYGENNLSISGCYHKIAELYSLMKNHPASLNYFFKELEIVSKIFGKSNQLSEIYGDISSVYEEMQEYDLAIQYLQSQIQTQDCAFTNNNSHTNGALINLDTHPASCYGRLGYIYFLKDDYAHALEAYKTEYEIVSSLYSKGKNPIFSRGLTKTYLAMHDYSNAIECLLVFFQKAKKEFTDNNKIFPESAENNLISCVNYRDRGDNMNAIRSIQKALKELDLELSKPEYDDSLKTQRKEYYQTHERDEEESPMFKVHWLLTKHDSINLIELIERYIPTIE